MRLNLGLHLQEVDEKLSHGSLEVKSTIGGRNHTRKDSWSTALEDETGAETTLDLRLNLVQP